MIQAAKAQAARETLLDMHPSLDPPSYSILQNIIINPCQWGSSSYASITRPPSYSTHPNILVNSCKWDFSRIAFITRPLSYSTHPDIIIKPWSYKISHRNRLPRFSSQYLTTNWSILDLKTCAYTLALYGRSVKHQSHHIDQRHYGSSVKQHTRSA